MKEKVDPVNFNTNCSKVRSSWVKVKVKDMIWELNSCDSDCPL